MRKCCFIIPYFGTMPNYFKLFLKSCATNPSFYWLIVTDDRTDYHYPNNVKTYYMSFEQLQALVQSKFDFPISLKFPYKLCDYKPAYGFIFEEEIKEYSYWGHCDLDTIMGDLSKFLTDELLSKYDKLFCLGHMTIYRNTPENNRVFMSSFKGKKVYQDIYSQNQNFWFDEEYHDEYNVNRIFLDCNKRVYTKDLSLNFYIKSTAFRRVKYVGFSDNCNEHGYQCEPLKPYLCVWKNGKILRYLLENGALKSEEYMYVHLQGRKFNSGSKVLASNIFKILPNKFLPLEVANVTASNFNQVKKRIICLHFWQCQWKSKKLHINRWINKYYRHE